MAESTAQMQCDLIVRNAILLTANKNNQIINSGAIAIDKGNLVAISGECSVMAEFTSEHIIDAQGAVVHPGFIDAHIHITQYTSRMVLPLMEKSTVTMGHWKEHLRPADEFASAALASMDLVRCGYTGFVDPGTAFDPESVAAAVERIGIRGWVTDPYVADRAEFLAERIPSFFSTGSLQHWPKNLDEAVDRIGKQLHRNQDPDSLVRGYVGIYGEGTDSLDLHQQALAIARANGVQFHKHLGYSPSLYHDLHQDGANTPVRVLQGLGLLDHGVTLIHMNRLLDDDLAALASSGSRILWCPYGQLAMLGLDPNVRGRMATAYRRGIPIGIASDIARGFNFDDLGKLAFAAANASGDPIHTAEIFLMRTRGAAAAIGALDELGSLEIGKRADFVVRRSRCSEDFGFDRYLELGIAGGKDTVDQVFVAGKQVLKDGRLTNADGPAIVWAAHASARVIATQIGLL